MARSSRTNDNPMKPTARKATITAMPHCWLPLACVA